MEKCIFCDIITGRSNAEIVYEDKESIAVMDKYPINDGHVLVMPKKHYATIMQMPSAEVGSLYVRVAKLAKAVSMATRAIGLNIGQNNGEAASQIVPHIHVHVIPRYGDDAPRGKWPFRKKVDTAQLKIIAESIRRSLATVSL
jgi:histidine triad (HIT) family protein